MQVYADVDYAAYRKGPYYQRYVTMRLYDGLSHIFTPSVAENLLTAVDEYSTVADIPDEVFDDIADWINEVKTKSTEGTRGAG